MHVYILTSFKSGQFFGVFDSLETAEMTLQHTLKERGVLHLIATGGDKYFYSLDDIGFVVERRAVESVVNTIRFIP